MYKKNTVVKEGITISSNSGKITSIVSESDDEGEVVSQVRTSSTKNAEGITIKDTSNIGSTKEKSSSVKTAEPKISDPRIRVARAIDPRFPADWSFTGKLSERLAAVKEHGATSNFLEALFAAEGDQMRRLLMKEYPDQFGSA